MFALQKERGNLEADVQPVPGDINTLLEGLELDNGDVLLETLKRVFGYDSFRDGQREVVERIIEGGDGIILMPTGGGKTLTFTLPALLCNELSIIVCPTVSLIQDLYERLFRYCKVFALTRDTAVAEKDAILLELQIPGCKLLLTTPEQLGSKILLSALGNITVNRLIIDEAHCVDEWGHQFRPSYLLLGTIKTTLKCQCVCFTATATNSTVMSIMKEMKLSNPFIRKQSFNRPNLHFSVKSKLSKPKTLKEITEQLKSQFSNQSCIVYCLTPEECNEICAWLIGEGLPCVAYHGNLNPEEKLSNMKKWLDDKVYIIVATKSLGMGIDKSSVRCVFHASLPANLHEYFQQAGRGGRDQQLSHCILYYRFQDRALHLSHIFKCDTEVVRRNCLQGLRSIISYCTTKDCLKTTLLKYFDEDNPRSGEMCSNCTNRCADEKDVTEHGCNVLLLLQALIPKIKHVSFNILTKVYKGSKDKDLLSKDLHGLPLYGAGQHLSIAEIESILVMLWVQRIFNRGCKTQC